mmetsp:Transcript_41365/g.88119  ORF Transcript_41365/g.88119 Transcript_41365/m.88119 type:complete len:271 (-) Transcript_41365:97-909(-)
MAFLGGIVFLLLARAAAVQEVGNEGLDTSAALTADDACLQGDDGACSVSLRQLRGVEKKAAVSSHKHEQAALAVSSRFQEQETSKANASAGKDIFGFCCFSASGSDMCTTCYDSAMAPEGDFCDSPDKCGGCGGTYCAAFCCFSGADANDTCGTCYPTALAKEGDYCHGSFDNCRSCGGTICKGLGPTVPPTEPPPNTTTTEAFDPTSPAACANNPGCADLEGYCCPARDGTDLGCCTEPAPAANGTQLQPDPTRAVVDEAEDELTPFPG